MGSPYAAVDCERLFDDVAYSRLGTIHNLVRVGFACHRRIWFGRGEPGRARIETAASFARSRHSAEKRIFPDGPLP